MKFWAGATAAATCLGLLMHWPEVVVINGTVFLLCLIASGR